MTRRWPARLALVAALGLPGLAAAQASALKVYPVAGLFGLDRSGCTSGAEGATVRIAPALCDQLSTVEKRAAWGAQFKTLVSTRFSGALRESLDGPLASGLTREAMLSQTVVASLHLSRADLWAVPKQSVVDVHMPITVSLMMTNVLTGEVMFVENLSTDVQGLMPAEGYAARAAAEFPARLNAAIATLVDNAATHFKPGAITGTVRGKAGNRYILDVGRKGGLRDGDQIGADASVVFADADYSIVEPALGSLSTGQKLVREIAQPVDNLARPSMLVVVAEAPAGLASAYLTTLMEDALGSSAGFAVMPINPSLAQIRDPALTAAGVAGRQRSLPDYFLRLSVAALAPIETDTNVANVRRRIQEARAFVEVVNHDGRVVFATQGVDQRIDEIVSGMAPSTDQRRDAAVKNAIIQAAGKLQTTFKPARLRLEARPANGAVRIVDAGGVLSPGVDAVVVRKVGRVSGIASDVWAPVTEVEVASIEGGEALANYAGVEAPRIQAGDQVAYEAAGPGSKSRRTFAQCLAAGAPSVSVRGSVVQPTFQDIALNSFASGFQGAVRVATFDKELRALQLDSQFSQISALGAYSAATPDVCFEPVHQVAPLAQRQERNVYQVSDYDMTIGYTLKKGADRIAGSGLKQKLTAAAVPVKETTDYKDRSLQLDLAAETTKLTLQAAKQITIPD